MNASSIEAFSSGVIKVREGKEALCIAQAMDLTNLCIWEHAMKDREYLSAFTAIEVK